MCKLPHGKKILYHKYVFNKKINADDMVRYKTHSHICSDSQNEGVDYFNTYAPTLSLTSFRVFLAHCDTIEFPGCEEYRHQLKRPTCMDQKMQKFTLKSPAESYVPHFKLAWQNSLQIKQITVRTQTSRCHLARNICSFTWRHRVWTILKRCMYSNT